MTTPSVDRPVSEPMTDIDPSRLDEIRDEFSGYDPGIKLGRVFGTPTVGEFHALVSMAARALPLPRRYTGGPLEDGLYLWRTMYWPNHRWVAEPSRADVEAVVNRFSIIWLIGPITIPDIPSEEAK